MKRLIMLLLVTGFFLIPTVVEGEVHGYLFFGQYLGTNIEGVEGRTIRYRAGLYLEKVKKDFTFFLKEETLIKDISGGGSHPIQIGYTLGLKLDIRGTDVIYKHSCNHPIDGTGDGDKAISYDIIEARFNF